MFDDQSVIDKEPENPELLKFKTWDMWAHEMAAIIANDKIIELEKRYEKLFEKYKKVYAYNHTIRQIKKKKKKKGGKQYGRIKNVQMGKSSR